MAFIPQFLLKKVYVTGSLRETAEGIAFDLFNSIGPGILTRLNQIVLNETVFPPQQIRLQVGEQVFQGHEISETNPAIFFHNQKTTCTVLGAKLVEGLHTITVDLFSREAGKIVVSIQDRYAGQAT